MKWHSKTKAVNKIKNLRINVSANKTLKIQPKNFGIWNISNTSDFFISISANLVGTTAWFFGNWWQIGMYYLRWLVFLTHWHLRYHRFRWGCWCRRWYRMIVIRCYCRWATFCNKTLFQSQTRKVSNVVSLILVSRNKSYCPYLAILDKSEMILWKLIKTALVRLPFFEVNASSEEDKDFQNLVNRRLRKPTIIWIIYRSVNLKQNLRQR